MSLLFKESSNSDFGLSETIVSALPLLQLIVLHGDFAFACMCEQHSGMQLLQTCFLWVWHCLQRRRACTMGVPSRDGGD